MPMQSIASQPNGTTSATCRDARRYRRGSRRCVEKYPQIEHRPGGTALPAAGFLCYQEQARRAKLIGLLIERTVQCEGP
jgi:hypothetical protein